MLEGRLADLIYADPPYSVAYIGSPKTRTRPILNDNLGKDFYQFLYESCASILAVCGGAVYISMGSSELHTLYRAFTEAGGHWSTYVIWVKNTFTLGRSNYQRQFEAILYGFKKGNSPFFCGARNLGDVWFIDKPHVNDLHPTMKPVALIERAILHSSQKGNLVLDPFGGSGSTVIACQKTSRQARLIELDPRYVDAAVVWWQAFSGKRATLATSGRTFEDIGRERQI